VCLPYLTSKITSDDEIPTMSTLGFRGAALASALVLSNALSLTARVKAEPIAEVRTDGTVARKSIDALIGMMVRATGFLHTLPVRRENMARRT
jgi:DNA mismatch repair ATPase MutL